MVLNVRTLKVIVERMTVSCSLTHPSRFPPSMSDADVGHMVRSSSETDELKRLKTSLIDEKSTFNDEVRPGRLAFTT